MKEIARQLFLSEKMVKHYMTNLLQKLQVRNRVEAALLARSEGLTAKDDQSKMTLVVATLVA